MDRPMAQSNGFDWRVCAETPQMMTGPPMFVWNIWPGYEKLSVVVVKPRVEWRRKKKKIEGNGQWDRCVPEPFAIKEITLYIYFFFFFGTNWRSGRHIDEWTSNSAFRCMKCVKDMTASRVSYIKLLTSYYSWASARWRYWERWLETFNDAEGGLRSMHEARVMDGHSGWWSLIMGHFIISDLFENIVDRDADDIASERLISSCVSLNQISCKRT